MAKRCPWCSICLRKKVFALVVLLASMWRARCVLPRKWGRGHRIVTILCDYGNRYQSKLFNPAFLRDKGLPVPRWLEDSERILPTVFEG